MLIAHQWVSSILSMGGTYVRMYLCISFWRHAGITKFDTFHLLYNNNYEILMGWENELIMLYLLRIFSFLSAPSIQYHYIAMLTNMNSNINIEMIKYIIIFGISINLTQCSSTASSNIVCYFQKKKGILENDNFDNEFDDFKLTRHIFLELLMLTRFYDILW